MRRDTQLRRSLRAKGGERERRWVDGGAVAVGLSVVLVAVGLSVIGPLTPETGVAVTAGCLLAGVALSGYFAAPSAGSGALHGVLVVACSGVLMGVAAGSTALGEGSPERVVLYGLLASEGPLALAVVSLATLATGAVVAEVVARIRSMALAADA
ncbi:hypothetical protein [Natronorarus salvus]|uniref:hypothetical protein n=1 Tax=Natronorarus salvus TaxID=3117733 RepID=UPI002F26C949